MRLAPATALAFIAALLVAPGARAQAGQSAADGPVTLTLPVCAQATGVSQAPVPGCSHVALRAKDGRTYYAHPSADGEIRMTGSRTSGRLSLPAAGQSWPGIAVPSGTVTVAVEKADIAGVVDDAGGITLTVPYDITVTAGVFGACAVSGTVTVSSSATDPVGGGQGRNRDATTGGFAAAGTSSPVLTGSLCRLAADYIDVGAGLGLYLDGSLDMAPAVAGQAASPRWPSRVKGRGRTVLLAAPVVTNAGQTAAVKVTWGTRRSARGTSARLARVKVRAAKVVIRTTGRAKRLFVRVTLSAPATPGFDAYRATRVWTAA